MKTFVHKDRKFLLPILISLLFIPKLQADTYKCFILINEFDCEYHNQGIEFLAKLDTSLQTTFVFREMNLGAAKKYLHILGLKDKEVLKAKITISSDLYLKLNNEEPTETSVVLTNISSSKIIFRCILEELETRYSIFNSYSKTWKYSYITKPILDKQSPMVKLSGYQDQTLIGVDISLHELVLIKNDSLIAFWDYRLFPLEKILSKIDPKSLTVYIQNQEELGNKVYSRVKIISQYRTDSTLYILLEIPRFKPSDSGEITVLRQYGVAQLDAAYQMVKLDKIGHDSISSVLPSKYLIEGNYTFHPFDNDKLILSVTKEKVNKKEKYIMASFQLGKNGYEFEKYDKTYTLPEVVAKSKTGYMFSQSYISDSIHYFSNYDKFYDIKSSKSFSANLLELTGEKKGLELIKKKGFRINYYIADVSRGDNTIQILLMIKNSFWVLTLDQPTYSLIRKEKVNTPENLPKIISGCFIGKNQIGFNHQDGSISYFIQE